jgi:sugar/nucleoside kinase (ribokinase family)
MLQKEVREQCKDAEFVAMDTMNFWIDSMKDAVLETVKVVDCVIINDAEARQLADEPNIHKAGEKDYGNRRFAGARYQTRRIRRGAFSQRKLFCDSAFPLESVFDPTGAGDTFAGGFMGYLASQVEITEDTLRRAMIYGSVMASFNVEEFGTERVDRLTQEEINERFRHFKRITHFDEIPFERATSA